jgi:hypothetical protein
MSIVTTSLAFAGALALAQAPIDTEQPGPHRVGYSDVAIAPDGAQWACQEHIAPSVLALMTGEFDDGSGQPPFDGAGVPPHVMGRMYFPIEDQGCPPADESPVFCDEGPHVPLAPPPGGEYPLVAFLHPGGHNGAHVDLCSHIASWGFAVLEVDPIWSCSIDLNCRVFSAQWEATKSQELMRALVDPASGIWPHAHVIDAAAPWSAVGHSLGALGSYYLAQCEPRVEVVVPLSGATDEFICNMDRPPDGIHGLFPPKTDQLEAWLGTWDGRAYQVAGVLDDLTLVEGARKLLRLADAAERNVLFEIDDMGHFGPSDGCSGVAGDLNCEDLVPPGVYGAGLPYPPSESPADCPDWQRMIKRITAAVLLAETRGEAHLLGGVFGTAQAGEGVAVTSTGSVPVTWAYVDAATRVLWGFAGREGWIAITWVHLTDPAVIPFVPYAVLPWIEFSASGWVELPSVDVSSSPPGQIWIQALQLSTEGAWSVSEAIPVSW